MYIYRKIEGGNIAFYLATNFQSQLTFWYMLVFILTLISLIQSLSCVQLFVAPWTAAPPCPSPTPGVHSDVHRVSDAIQPSHPLSSPFPPAPNPSQHQSLFQWVNSSHEVDKVLEFQLQRHSFQRNVTCSKSQLLTEILSIKPKVHTAGTTCSVSLV